MNWLTQTHGTINHYKPQIHPGNQPVRVIHHMLIYMFQNTHPDFFKELQFQIQAGKVDQHLDFNFDESPIHGDGRFRTPRVNIETKKIELHETFLSYLWGCTYAIYVLYVENIDYPRINKESGRIVHLTKQDKIDEAQNLFDYVKSLMTFFDLWDKDELPNPEIYQAEDRDYVEQTNLFYTEAVKFILCHEFTHLTKHADQLDTESPDDKILDFEIEADNDAIDLIKRGINYSNDAESNAHRMAVEIGAVIGILSSFFLKSSTVGVRHPNTEDRLSNLLERLKLNEDNFAWGLSCIGLKLWDEQFGKNLIWKEDFLTYKTLYYDLVTQIKEKQ